MWMERTSIGSIYSIGEDKNIWSDPDISDLISLHDSAEIDIFNGALSRMPKSLIRFYHRAIG
jgi:hypothetical protein